jgi:hypothetical protein
VNQALLAYFTNGSSRQAIQTRITIPLAYNMKKFFISFWFFCYEFY